MRKMVHKDLWCDDNSPGEFLQKDGLWEYSKKRLTEDQKLAAIERLIKQFPSMSQEIRDFLKI